MARASKDDSPQKVRKVGLLFCCKRRFDDITLHIDRDFTLEKSFCTYDSERMNAIAKSLLSVNFFLFNGSF